MAAQQRYEARSCLHQLYFVLLLLFVVFYIVSGTKTATSLEAKVYPYPSDNSTWRITIKSSKNLWVAGWSIEPDCQSNKPLQRADEGRGFFEQSYELLQVDQEELYPGRRVWLCGKQVENVQTKPIVLSSGKPQ
ncbi:hypothetical protein QAD02_005903 [Eretmocerus hayati]|uniref:Uncharacterized protein n=1 Tax=Eretmocerus hayati TaxID=131215 RepID=A0ACC2N0J9_9HYME|nr:hypothetical protein QAD02_005903 [Eretmocerus hayati]